MKKCLCCLNTKLFMKLTNGLCSTCYSDFKKCEDEYKTLLKKVTTKGEDPSEIIASINLLMIKLRKFDSISNSVKSSDCIELLKILSTFNNTKNIELNNLSFQTPVNNSSESSKKNDDSTLTNDVISNESTNSLIHNINNVNPDNPLNPLPLNTEDNLLIKNPDPTVTTVTYEPIKPLVTPELINEATDIIYKLKDENIGIDELCYCAFTLKETYLPLLKDISIAGLDDINIKKIIENSLNKASIVLDCEVDTIYSYYNYVTYSIQTTGLKAENSNIIEIAAAKVKFGQVEDTFHTLVNPVKTISRSIEEKTNIKNENLHNAPTIDIAIKSFCEFVEDLTLVSHNSNYNYGFIKYNYERIYGKEFNSKTDCSMKLYRKRYKQFHGEPPKDSTLNYCYNDVLSESDIEFINNTDSIALSNALGTYKLYEVIKNRYK